MTDSGNEFDRKARDWDTDPAKMDQARRVAHAMRRLVPISPTFTALTFRTVFEIVRETGANRRRIFPAFLMVARVQH